MECRFTVKGRRIVATAEQVETALRDVEPDKVRVHSVEVNGRVYPVMQALAEAFDLPRARCHPHVACRVFRQLGFPVAASSRRPRRQTSRNDLRKALPKRSPEIGPVEDESLELPPIHLRWSRWERWQDVAEHGLAILDVPAGQSGVYEVTLDPGEERLYIGRASDLRARVLHALIWGTMGHPAGERIRANEDLSKVWVRWSPTDRPAAVEEELHRRHIATFGRLPKYTSRT